MTISDDISEGSFLSGAETFEGLLLSLLVPFSSFDGSEVLVSFWLSFLSPVTDDSFSAVTDAVCSADESGFSSGVAIISSERFAITDTVIAASATNISTAADDNIPINLLLGFFSETLSAFRTASNILSFVS